MTKENKKRTKKCQRTTPIPMPLCAFDIGNKVCIYFVMSTLFPFPLLGKAFLIIMRERERERVYTCVCVCDNFITTATTLLPTTISYKIISNVVTSPLKETKLLCVFLKNNNNNITAELFQVTMLLEIFMLLFQLPLQQITIIIVSFIRVQNLMAMSCSDSYSN